MADLIRDGKKTGRPTGLKQHLLHYQSLVDQHFTMPSAPQANELPGNQANKPVILVVEDNADEWFLIRWGLLQEFPGIEPVWCSTPQQATAYLNTCLDQPKALPCIILVDLYLPTVQDGLGILQALKTHERLQTIPLITISRSKQTKDIINALTDLSEMYIIKPDNYGQWRETFSPFKNYLPK